MLTVARGFIGILGVAAAASALPAAAADIRTAAVGDSRVILVSGSLMLGDGERFERIAAGLPKATKVVLESPGGNLLAGLKIGETARARGLTTIVGDGAMCASACAIAWLGGTTRYLSAGGRLGFHAASGLDGVSSGGNAIVGAYMAKLGLNSDTIYSLTSASPDSIAWVDLSTARTMGIAVQSYVGPSFGGSTRLASGEGGRPSYGGRPDFDGRAMPRPASSGSVSPYENGGRSYGGGSGYDGGARDAPSRDDNSPSNPGR